MDWSLGELHDDHEFLFIIEVRRRDAVPDPDLGPSQGPKTHPAPKLRHSIYLLIMFFYFLLNRKGWIQEGFFLQPSPELRYRGLRSTGISFPNVVTSLLWNYLT